MVEFAIVAPVVILLMIGMADLALVVAGNSAGGNSAREGARYGIINFDCADAYTANPQGLLGYDTTKCGNAGWPNGTGSADYNAIVGVVTGRVSGLVQRGSIKVDVRCISGADATLTTKFCTDTGIDRDKDLIEVKVSWTSLGASPFAAKTHSDLARLVIQGIPTTTNVGATTTAPSTTAASTTSSSSSTTSVPKPTIGTLTMYDVDIDGKVDRVVAVFTTVTINSFCNSAWSAANVPSGGALNTAGITINTGTNTVTIPVNEGANPADTSVGSFTITFVPGGGCNANGFGPSTPVDGAAPVVMAVTGTSVGGGTIRKMEAGDTLAITFSEPVTNYPASVFVIEDRPNGNGNVTLNITGNGVTPDITQGALDTGTDTYMSAKKTTAQFGGAAVLVASVLTITVATPCTGDCANVQQGTASPFTFNPATNITDAANNTAVKLAVGPVPTGNFGIF